MTKTIQNPSSEEGSDEHRRPQAYALVTILCFSLFLVIEFVIATPVLPGFGGLKFAPGYLDIVAPKAAVLQVIVVSVAMFSVWRHIQYWKRKAMWHNI